MDPLEIAALQWRMCVEHTCCLGRQLPENRFTECQLPDFGLEQLKRVLRYCDLNDALEVVEAFRWKFDAKPASARSQSAESTYVELVRQLITPTNI